MALRVSLLLDTARGMLALHSHMPRAIVHRDLKSLNVLVFEALGGLLVAKVADFGLAHTLSTSTAANTKTKGGQGSAAWMAPEVYDAEYSEASDVWAFGMVAFEVRRGASVGRWHTATKEVISHHQRPPPPPVFCDRVRIAQASVQGHERDADHEASAPRHAARRGARRARLPGRVARADARVLHLRAERAPAFLRDRRAARGAQVLWKYDVARVLCGTRIHNVTTGRPSTKRK